ncbi:MAG: PfkB family carbohydrate kinase [Pyrinomonadaceae bacterium]
MISTKESKALPDIVREFSHRRILVVGDAIADQFVYGEISRVSREAPVFILRHEHTETAPGGAANCAANLTALGARVSLISVVGKDEPGTELLRKLDSAGVDCSGVVVSPNQRTTTKVRVLAGQSHSTRQQVIRIDYDGKTDFDGKLRDQITGQLTAGVQSADAMIISDYGYGVGDPSVTETVRTAGGVAGIPILVDSRFRLSGFSGLMSATPNEDELVHLIGHEPADVGELEAAGGELCQHLDYRALLITRGSNGMMLIEPGKKPLHIAAVGPHEPVDVTGAGDTVIATYALALASGASFAQAAQLANLAGGAVVMKRGTATVTAEELTAAALGQNQGAAQVIGSG